MTMTTTYATPKEAESVRIKFSIPHGSRYLKGTINWNLPWDTMGGSNRLKLPTGFLLTAKIHNNTFNCITLKLYKYNLNGDVLLELYNDSEEPILLEGTASTIRKYVLLVMYSHDMVREVRRL